jgi:hypothetical protein
MSEHPNLGSSIGDPTDRWLGPAPGVAAEAVRGRRSVWAGWIAFASQMMIMMGAFNAIEGLTGVLVDDFYVATAQDVLVFDVTTWGWIHLVVGVLVAITGAALLTGATWARVLTVVFTILNAVAQLAFAAVYPVWSLIVISLCVVVIWAVVVHGDEETPEYL